MIGMAINSNADIDAKREILSRLQELCVLSSEVGLWFAGREATITFGQMCMVMANSIEDSKTREATALSDDTGL